MSEFQGGLCKEVDFFCVGKGKLKRFVVQKREKFKMNYLFCLLKRNTIYTSIRGVTFLKAYQKLIFAPLFFVTYYHNINFFIH